MQKSFKPFLEELCDTAHNCSIVVILPKKKIRKKHLCQFKEIWEKIDFFKVFLKKMAVRCLSAKVQFSLKKKSGKPVFLLVGFY